MAVDNQETLIQHENHGLLAPDDEIQAIYLLDNILSYISHRSQNKCRSMSI